jgi:nicotinamidase-related amidase
LIEGTWGADFSPSVAPQGGDVVVINKATGAFTTSDLRDRLAPLGLTTLLLAGVATNFVVESTAREGSDLGYEVIIVRDCCTSVSDEMHETALKTSLPHLATIVASDEVEAALA